MTGLDCTTAREWLSAARDGEAGAFIEAEEHLESCTACVRWSAAFDRVTRVARLRSPRPSNELRLGVERAVAGATSSPGSLVGAQLTLAVAAVGTAAALLLAVSGVHGHSHLGSPDGRDADAFMFSLAGGSALTAWRPARLAAGFLPVAVLAALVTGVMSAIALAAGETTLGAELPHVPILLSAVGATWAYRVSEPAVRAAEIGVRRPAHA